MGNVVIENWICQPKWFVLFDSYLCPTPDFPIIDFQARRAKKPSGTFPSGSSKGLHGGNVYTEVLPPLGAGDRR